MPVTGHPPHRSVRAQLAHTAPILDEWRRSAREGRDEECGGSGLRNLHLKRQLRIFFIRDLQLTTALALARRQLKNAETLAIPKSKILSSSKTEAVK